MSNYKYYLPLLVLLLIPACSQSVANLEDNQTRPAKAEKKVQKKMTDSDNGKVKLATFAGGCFWCTEAVFQKLKGVKKVVSGYSGGSEITANYKAVCTGTTGHAEVIQISYDPEVVDFKDLLEIFWKTHDPTTLNQQGADRGTQYRSAVFYHDKDQKKVADEIKKKIEDAKIYDNPIVTEISPIKNFFPAEDYHQNYFQANSRQPYCAAVIQPKIDKLEKIFKEKLK